MIYINGEKCILIALWCHLSVIMANFLMLQQTIIAIICVQKGTFSCMIKCLLSITRHSAILYRKSIKFGIQEGVCMLDTKFPVHNGGMTSD